MYTKSEVDLWLDLGKFDPRGILEFSVTTGNVLAGNHFCTRFVLSGREEVLALRAIIDGALACIDVAQAEEEARIKQGLPAWDTEVPF
ncbi:hypothetical protein D3C72_2264520 [compost metagenome]